jgi:hypothetical protein
MNKLNGTSMTTKTDLLQKHKIWYFEFPNILFEFCIPFQSVSTEKVKGGKINDT